MWRRLRTSSIVRQSIGRTVGAYLKFAWKTQRHIIEPHDFYDWIDGETPIILTFWHGQHFLTPFLPKPHHRGTVMISRSFDADINAIAVESLGFGTIRGSGSHIGRFHEKGGVSATRKMIEALAGGCNVAMTADVPKVSRRAGLGVVSIAKHSGRPIFPVAIATSRRIVMKKSWDQSSLNLPFGRAATVLAEPVRVPASADDAALEAARAEVEHKLNQATARAEALAGGATAARDAR
jgi:lysophospholipid acyltransferase (LPLAT)-like uncharacterized protein